MKEKRSFIAKTKWGKKFHIFAQPFGYPIMACQWEHRNELGEIGQEITCLNCLKIRDGTAQPTVEFDRSGL